jgi:hypothetical protein
VPNHSGLELCRLFYAEAVRPLLGDLPHAAARIGGGSDVLGFDTERSTDHDWGPRLELFLAGGYRADIDEMLAQRLLRRPDNGPAPAGVVSGRSVALRAGLPVAPDRAGGVVRGARGRRRRRLRVAADGRAVTQLAGRYNAADGRRHRIVVAVHPSADPVADPEFLSA